MENISMYGTVAKMRLKPGAEVEMNRLTKEWSWDIPGYAFQYVYKLDSDPNEFMLVVGFDSKDSYLANAGSPEQAARYEQYRAFMESDPIWHDGEIILADQH
jgi:hypothetical protein